MLFRFCLYGFLKNQQYYDPFLVLAFLQKGLSFAMIGLLIGFREVCVNLMEIPAGAVADVLGRRRSMVVSFLAYIGSFVIFGTCDVLWALFVAMFLFAVGTAFRTGTHKAMIFDWLERQDRLAEKTAVYGRTRSWSKLGSALSVVIAAALVFWTEQYSAVFLVCVVPYSLCIINFLAYPAYLDGPPHEYKRLSTVARTMLGAIGRSFRHRKLRRLLIEAMGYEGLFQSGKDYLQPVLKSACLTLPIMLAMAERRRVAILVGAVYFVLHIAGSIASRRADSFAKAVGGEARSMRVLWLVELAIFSMMAVGILAGVWSLTIVAFVLLAVFQNLWRPILIGRVADHAEPRQAATVLSIESQSKSLFVAVAAPFLGWAIDLTAAHDPRYSFLPVAALGIAISALMLLGHRTFDSV